MRLVVIHLRVNYELKQGCTDPALLNLYNAAEYLWALSMEPASHQFSGTLNFVVAPIFSEKLGSPELLTVYVVKMNFWKILHSCYRAS